MKVVHVISGLGAGGAETTLQKLLASMERSRFEARVVSLKGAGVLGKGIAAMGIPVRTLDLTGSRAVVRGVPELARWLRREAPDVVQTWLYHADLLGGLAAVLAGRIPVLWNLRHSDFDATTRRSTSLAVAACARLAAWVPTRIVSCSEEACRVHARLGYPADRMVVIPNGVDLGRFRPDPEARAVVRRELGVPESAPLVGLVARHHPQKDHATFFAAARRLAAERPSVRFLLCGSRVDWQNQEIVSALRAARLDGRVSLLGRRDDVYRLEAALDIACSSSAFGEGFSNVVAEAMACGVPCVVTDVGDSAKIVADTGRVVPRRDPAALAAALRELVDLEGESRWALGTAARLRIERNFGLAAAVRRYEELYEEVAGAHRRRRATAVGAAAPHAGSGPA